MVKSDTAFSWQDGRTPTCKIHSRAKLDILRSYLLSYFSTIAAKPVIDAVNVHLVDAFAGGGIFKDSQTSEPVLGSPLVMLQAVQQAEQIIAADKTKPFSINARYHFADMSESAILRLRQTINDAGFGAKISNGSAALICATFEDFLPQLLSQIPSRSRTKAIFFLDQTGWNVATLNHCNTILRHLPKAEIIWNISVQSLSTFANENNSFRRAIKTFGVELGDALSAQSKFDNLSDWRKALIAIFLQQIRQSCLAKYVSPFMIQHDGWGYWLLHLSNHSEANNVMKSTHWLHQNSSLHEGFPGLKMLEFTHDNWAQTTMWRFDEDARAATHEALVAELCPRISELGEAPTVKQLIESIANETPADRNRLYAALNTLRGDKELLIVGPKREHRQRTPQSLDDRILLSKQPKLFG